ncbi:MAG: LPS-assembly protein LptD [Bacteroidales bacterium]|nr:LPS-assembly protein LptD [Bacteroidales bacterium]
MLLAMTVPSGLQPSFVYAQQRSERADSEGKSPRLAMPDSAALAMSDSASMVMADSTSMAMADSLASDSTSHRKPGGGLTAVVNYKSSDSLVFSMGNMAWLYGSSEVTYDDINLSAERIQMSLDSSLVHAYGIPDTTAQEGSKRQIGAPVFKDKSGEYQTRTISYNFKTAKGYITDVVTQQGEGYVTGGTTKKMPDNDIFLENGRYTTCDYHDCPHFYINLTKARVRPKKNIVTGPAYLVVADVPLPLAIPFGYFPFTKSYSSGILMPSYGADQTRGLYLRDGGYYFAINDYIDLALRGEIYTKGSWGISATSKYAWRYKFKGNMSFSYLKTITGDKGMPDYSESTNIRAVWSHTQDSRFNPNMTLSANVNFSTTGYERNNLASYYSSEMTQSTKSSTVNLSYRIPNSLWSFNASASVTQRMQDSTLVVSLPELSIAMSRTYPFKRKVKVGEERWYEKIALSYSGRMTNSITTKQDEFMEKSLIRDWQNGMSHSIPISASFNLFKYISVTPSFSFTDRMYSHKTVQSYDETYRNSDGSYGAVMQDTVYGFYNSYNYSTSLSFNTKLYGFYKPAPFFKNAKLVAVRHLFTPSVSFSYTPDFGRKKYGSWSSYQMQSSSSAEPETVYYSYFSGYKYGTTSRGRTGAISFSMANNIEAKIRSDKDSTGYRKISIIDNLTSSISYNLAADSMRWSQTIPLSVVVKMGKSGSMNLSGTFDTYMYGLTSSGSPVRIDKPRWEVGKFPRLMNTGYSYSYQLNNKKLAALFGFGDGKDTDSELDEDAEEESDLVEENLDPSYAKEKEHEHGGKKDSHSGGTYDADGYYIWSIPWTMNLSYTMRYAYGQFNKSKMEYDYRLTHSATVSGTIQPTKGWNFSYNLSYNFNDHEVTYMNMSCTRDMHCWTLTASMNPLGRYASFHVCIAVKSSMLQDLKYEKSTVSGSNKINWYDD